MIFIYNAFNWVFLLCLNLEMSRTAENCLEMFFGSIAEASQKNGLTFAEFGVRPVSMPIEVFTLLVAEGLELGEESIALCLMTTRKAVQKGLHVSRRCLYRYICLKIGS